MNPSGFFLQPRVRPHFVSHFQYTGANRMLSVPECEAIIAMAEARGFQTAAIGNPGASQVNEAYRCASVCTLEHGAATAWIYEHVTQLVQGANQHFDFELTGLLEPFQVIRYDEPKVQSAEAGHYDWHQDFGADYMSRRKISVVAQLSDPAEYSGCRLTIMDPGPRELEGEYAERGAGVTFPSWLPHCVTPITRGRRHALVAWVHGSPFR